MAGATSFASFHSDTHCVTSGAISEPEALESLAIRKQSAAEAHAAPRKTDANPDASRLAVNPPSPGIVTELSTVVDVPSTPSAQRTADTRRVAPSMLSRLSELTWSCMAVHASIEGVQYVLTAIVENIREASK